MFYEIIYARDGCGEVGEYGQKSPTRDEWGGEILFGF